MTNSNVVLKLFRDHPTLMQPGAGSVNLAHLAAGSNLLPGTNGYRSPLMDMKHNVFRCSVAYGLSAPMKFKLPTPLAYNPSIGDRVALVALRAPYHNKRGERVANSLEPEHWPIPPNQILKLEVDGGKVGTTYKKNWPTSRRNDLGADAPIRRSYLFVDVTEQIKSDVAGGQHTLRYEMLDKSFAFDIGVFVYKRLPAALIVTDFLKRIQNDDAKLQEQRRHLKRFYTHALGLNKRQKNGNNNSNNDDDDEEDELVAGDPTMTLRCPITYSTVKIPVRGRLCDHLQCVDFEYFVESCNTMCFWSCPLCDKPMALDDVVWDPLVHRLLNKCLAGAAGAAFDAGGTTFALKLNPHGGDEVIIGGVPAMFENLSSPSSSTRVSGGGGGGDQQNNNNNMIAKNNSQQILLVDSEVVEPSTKNKNQQQQNQQQPTESEAFLRAVQLSLEDHQRREVTQKLIRRQDSQLTRTNSMAFFSVKGNSKTDAIEID